MGFTMPSWKENIAVLEELRVDWNDKLDLANLHLKLEKGNHLRKPGQSILSHPSQVVEHLEMLVDYSAKNCLTALKTSYEETPEFYEEVADFIRQFKCLSRRISDLSYTFRREDCSKSDVKVRLNKLYDQSFECLKEIKKYKSTLKKPLLAERPLKHIEYNERTKLSSIKWNYPKRVPLEETVAVAKKAFNLSQIKVESENLSIIDWVKNQLFNLVPQAVILQDQHIRAYQLYSSQILHCPVITKEVIEAFKELAPHANLLDLKSAILASEDVTELAPYMKEDTIPLDQFLQLVQEKNKKKNTEVNTLEWLASHYENLHRFFIPTEPSNMTWQEFLEKILLKDNYYLDAHLAYPHISPNALIELIETAASSPACEKINISKSLSKIQFVKDLLKQFNYNLEKDNGYDEIYKREPIAA